MFVPASFQVLLKVLPEEEIMGKQVTVFSKPRASVA
jgi:hypothetical protein